MERLHRNNFLKGVQADIDQSISPSDTYLEAHNLILSKDNGFLGLTNIKGTLNIDGLAANFTGDVIGFYANKYKIGDTPGLECLTIFEISSDDKFKIWCYDIANATFYQLFEQEYTAEFEAAKPEIDLVLYPENGLDIIYFTDNFNEIRKIRCEIPLPHTFAFLTPEQISLQRRGVLGTLSLENILSSGGSLLTGSYQFVFRLYNKNRESYTKWSIPSTPIIISRAATPNQGGYGMSSTKQIQLSITVPTYDVGNWTHYQVAVFDNVQAANVINAGLQKIISTTTGSPSGENTIFTYTYKENTKIAEVAIEDIVVDLAPLKTVKTLQVKNNKLFGGNLTYWNRTLESDPVVTGSIATQTTTGTNDFQLSKYKGYWRDEVYRYYISYFDEFNNYSRPVVMDMSVVTGNTISNGDMRFPSRKKAGYTLLDGSSNPRALGLNLTINNHPSWARGFVILRAERKKRIKYQTPFVPSSQIQGIEAIGKYPTTATILVGSSLTERNYTAAQPMNPLGTIIPKNFFHTIKKDILTIQEDNIGNFWQKGECRYTAALNDAQSNSIYFCYPPNGYGLNTYSFEQGDKFDIVDYAFLRLNYKTYQTNAFETKIGNFIQTSVHGTFYATSIEDYYYSNSVDRVDPGFPNKTGDIVDFKQLDALGEGTSIQNNSVCQISNLDTPGGAVFNTLPANQVSSAVFLKSAKRDSTIYGRSAYGVNQLTSSSGATVEQSLYEFDVTEQTNTFCISKAAINSNTRVAIVDIANITNDLGDDRYGDPDDIHDVVFTGASYTFTASELTQIRIDGQVSKNLQVWGGDSFVTLQQVKVTDSHFSLINYEKFLGGPIIRETDLLKKWSIQYGNKFDNSTDYGPHVIAMPVSLKNVSQVLSTYIESEVLCDVLAPYPYDDSVLVNNKYIISEDNQEFKLRIPFAYIYNANYSKNSNQKAFIPFDPNERIVTSYPARIIFSDQKIYQTDIQGFDIFRVGNISDLEETYRGITKLALDGDRMVAIQESACAYLPIDANVIETADASRLAVRSGNVIDIPLYISRQYGSQHLRTVLTVDDGVYFADNNNQSVIKISGQQLKFLNEEGNVSKFNELFAEDLSSMIGVYDINRRQYWLSNKTTPFTIVWDDRFKCWIGEFDFADQLYGAVFAYNKLYMMGRDTEETLGIYTMYEGDYNQLFGTIVTPSVSFAINPEFEYAKTFDDVVIYSTDRLDTVDMETQREAGETGQVVTGINIDVNRREGNYRAAVLRDVNSARLRGVRAKATIYWKPDNTQATLSSVVTKYRISQRSI
jgi:hypothetical protein